MGMQGSGFHFLRLGAGASLVLFLNGCMLFSSPSAPAAPDGDYVERLALPRTEQQLARGELVVALWAGPENQAETAAVRNALQKGSIRLKIISVSRREALSPMLRAGRADLIAGAFTPDEVRDLHLLPLLPYTGTDRMTGYCFAARRGDHLLENLLGPATGTEGSAGEKEKKP